MIGGVEESVKGSDAVESQNQRAAERRPTDCNVELTWKTHSGEKLFEQCRALDLSETGVAIECPESIPPMSNVIVWAPAFQVAALAQVRHCTWRDSIYVLGLHFIARTTTVQHDPCAPDHYEILRLSPKADDETIERVFKTLALRFHPDNQRTGDAETFLRINEAYRVLSNPQRRAAYDCEREVNRATPRFQLRSPEFFNGIVGEQNRRLATLCLLYRKRTSNYEFPGHSLLELEQLTACTREELGFSLWYLCEKGLCRVSDCAEYTLTAEGVDFVETKLMEDRPDLRAIAAFHRPDTPRIAGLFPAS
jgi:hypothetical protein